MISQRFGNRRNTLSMSWLSAAPGFDPPFLRVLRSFLLPSHPDDGLCHPTTRFERSSSRVKMSRLRPLFMADVWYFLHRSCVFRQMTFHLEDTQNDPSTTSTHCQPGTKFESAEPA